MRRPEIETQLLEADAQVLPGGTGRLPVQFKLKNRQRNVALNYLVTMELAR